MIRGAHLEAFDLFCGAGGMTLGAEASGSVKVTLAVNHWRTAVETHRLNHPNTRHICARIEDFDLRTDQTLPKRCDLLMGGIECTHHSNARGGQPINDQRRTSAWRVLDWIQRWHPRWCVFENVREFLKWGPIDSCGRKIKSKAGQIFEAWVSAIRSHGYHVEWKLLNAADYGEATKRVRLFIVCRRGHSDEPFAWPEPTHSQQWRSAADIIDWSRPCPSIFSRKRPLAEKTLRRIEHGLRRFVEPFVIQTQGPGYGDDGYAGVHAASEPMRTLLARNNHGIVVPQRAFLVQYHSGKDPSKSDTRTASIKEPLPTLDTQPRYAIARPFVVDIHNGSGEGRTNDVDTPLGTIVAKPGFSVAMPYLVDVNHGGDAQRVNSTDEPIGTITTKRGKALIHAFLTQYYGTGQSASIDAPLSTITTKHRHGLALIKTMEELGVVDVGFRMLDVDELAAAQGFPAEYELTGNKADQIRQIGNAVCPRVMTAICKSVSEDQ